MKKREYYSTRTGKVSPTKEVTFTILKRMFLLVYEKLEEEYYLQKYFGYYCVDQDYVKGQLGNDINSVMFINIHKDKLFPIATYIQNYTEDDLFDVIEFVHDHCSKGIEGYFHSFNNCGWHYKKFDDHEGQKYFRELLNPILKDYQGGFEISGRGEILSLPDEGMMPLLEADIPTSDEENIRLRIENAKLKFRRHRSTWEDRKEAIRELADVLEYLRPEVQKLIDKKDEGDIFNIANNFGIRHHNTKQQTNYDRAIWYSWIFYYYLATIHALLRMIEKAQKII